METINVYAREDKIIRLERHMEEEKTQRGLNEKAFKE
jgi:hypothetical protein